MIYKMSSAGALAKDFGMRDQIQRAGVSGMTNIAEGFDCESTAEFSRFLGIARRAIVGVQSLLYAAWMWSTLKKILSKCTINKLKRRKRSSVV